MASSVQHPVLKNCLKENSSIRSVNFVSRMSAVHSVLTLTSHFEIFVDKEANLEEVAQNIQKNIGIPEENFKVFPFIEEMFAPLN